MADRSIVVVGAGIMGASLAYHLAGRGRPVTLIDAGLPGLGATRASFAWIGRPVTSDLPSASLRYLALDEYRRLETELPELSIRWSGSLSWDGFDETPGPSTDDAGSLEPHLLNPPAVAIHRPEDAAFDPVAVIIWPVSVTLATMDRTSWPCGTRTTTDPGTPWPIVRAPGPAPALDATPDSSAPITYLLSLRPTGKPYVNRRPCSGEVSSRSQLR